MRRMQTQKLANPQQILRPSVKHRIPRKLRRQRTPIRIMNLHPQRPPPPRHRLPDPPHPENPQHFPRTIPSQQPRSIPFRPRPAAHQLLRLISPPRSPQQQQNRHVRRRVVQHARSIRNRNSPRRRRPHVNVIVPHRKSSNHLHTRCHSPEKFRIQPHRIKENRIRPLRLKQQLFQPVRSG